MSAPARHVALYDGDCRFCTRWRDRMIGRDPRELMEARAPPILRTELMPKLLSSELSVARTTAVMLRPDGTRVQRTTSSRR